MASTTDDAEAAAERLETALERIARAAASRRPPQDAVLDDVRSRLDRMIERLRAALES